MLIISRGLEFLQQLEYEIQLHSLQWRIQLSMGTFVGLRLVIN